MTAVFAANDQMAMGLIAALREAGRAVPDDISVVGFDDLPESAYLAPPLTTVRQDFAELGRRAMGLVERAVNGEDRPAVDLVPTTLVLRSSTAAPSSRQRRQPAADHRPTGRWVLTSVNVSAHTPTCERSHINSGSPDLVVGIDFGTLSGRAVVVTVDEGRELGSATHEYAHGVLEASLPDGTRARPRLGPAGAGRLRRGPASRRTRGAGGRRCRPRPRDRDRHRLHRLHPGADHRRRHAPVRAARARRRPARLRQAVEAPRRAAAGRPDQRARREAGRGLAAAVRRPDLLGVGVRQGPPGPRGEPGHLRRHRRASSRRRTGSCGSSAGSTCATPAPPATRGSTRTAPTPPATSWPS